MNRNRQPWIVLLRTILLFLVGFASPAAMAAEVEDGANEELPVLSIDGIELATSGTITDVPDVLCGSMSAPRPNHEDAPTGAVFRPHDAELPFVGVDPLTYSPSHSPP